MQINKVPFSQFKAVMRNALSLSKKSALKIILFDLSFVALIGICYGVVALLFAILSPILPKWLIIILGIISLIAVVYLSATLFARVFYSKINFIWRIRNHEAPKIKDLWRGLSPPMSLARINVYFVLSCLLFLVIVVLCAIFAPNVSKSSNIVCSLAFYVIVTISEFAVIGIILNEITPKQALIDASKIVKTNIALTLIMPIAISYVVSILFLLCFLLLPSKAVIVISGILYFSFFMYWQVVLLNYDLSIYQMSVDAVSIYKGYNQQSIYVKETNVTNNSASSARKKKILATIISFCILGTLAIKLIQYFKPSILSLKTTNTTSKWLDLRNESEQHVKIDPQFNYYTNAIALSLNEHAIKTVGVKNSDAYYDKFNNGINGSTGWVESSAGILMFESSNGEFIIVGASGVLNNGEMIQTAYQSLSELNGSESEINRSSPIYHKLRVWVGGNGLKGSGKLKTLDELGIKSLATTPLIVNNVELSGGNKETGFANFSYDDGRLSMTNSIRLIYSPIFRVFSQAINIESVSNLPNLSGAGNVRDLREAMVLSPALKRSVIEYMNKSYTDKQHKIDEIVQLWAATSTVKDTLASTLLTGENRPDTGKRGTNLSESDIAKLEFIEQFTGYYGGVKDFKDPEANSIDGRFRYRGDAPHGLNFPNAKGLESEYIQISRLVISNLDNPQIMDKESNLEMLKKTNSTATESASEQSIITLINQHKDSAAINVLPKLSVQDKQNLAQYIESNVTSMKPPYIFWLSEQKYQNSHLDQAAFYYLFARLRLVEDIERCNDASAGDGVFMLIGKLAPNAMVYTTQTISSKKRYFIGKHVVRLDSKHPNQLSPQWICVHGIKAFSSNGVQIASKSNWDAIYTEQRNNFIKILKKSESNTIRKQK
ncbi:MAG TPA: hypothetical protein PLP75_01660 [Burkholderiales bacterium]|nr:hypothetical protein [Burkholderiales bacterium]